MTPATKLLNENIERDRQRREAAAFGHRQPILQRKRQTADDSWWEDH